MKNLILFPILFCAIFVHAQKTEVRKISEITIKKDKDVPADVHKWLEKELNNAPRKELIDPKGDEFFDMQSARIVGYIKGYSPGAEPISGIVNLYNTFLNIETPMPITIYEDGRFEVNIPMDHPRSGSSLLYNQFIPFYIEQGQTLSMILDWEVFAKTNKNDLAMYDASLIQYDGTAASVNAQLSRVAAILPESNYWASEKVKTKEFNFEEITEYAEQKAQEYTSALEELFGKEKFSEQAKTILRNDAILAKAEILLRYKGRAQNEKEKRPDTYFDFLKEIDFSDQTLFASKHFEKVINTIQFSQPLSVAAAMTNDNAFISSPKLTLEQYLLDELGIDLSEETSKIFGEYEKLKPKLKNEELDADQKATAIEWIDKVYVPAIEEYQPQMSDYFKKYVIKSWEQREQEQYALQDSIIHNVLQLDGWIIDDVLRARQLDFNFRVKKDEDQDYDRTKAYEFASGIDSTISNEIVKLQIGRLLDIHFPAEERELKEFMDVKGADIMRKLIEPLKGKILFVDFWGLSCGPCIYEITKMKEAREKYRDNPDFEFVFITSEGDGPKERYDQFVEEQGLVNTYRISDKDFIELRHLFQFIGIPYYVVLNQEGKILIDRFQMHNFEFEKDKVLEKSRIASISLKD